MAKYNQFIYDFMDNGGILYGDSIDPNTFLKKDLVNLNKTNTNYTRAWDKVGIQGPPGMIFTINDERMQFVLGPSGIYEIENIYITKFYITSLGYPGTNGHHNIVIDYREV